MPFSASTLKINEKSNNKLSCMVSEISFYATKIAIVRIIELEIISENCQQTANDIQRMANHKQLTLINDQLTVNCNS